jgi:hypothetical protein
MEKYDWYCPLCGTYHHKYINEWKSEKCTTCHNEIHVNKRGEVANVTDRYNNYDYGYGNQNFNVYTYY